MAISVERLEALCERPPQRIGLSATQRPLEEIGRFVSGARPITLVDAGTRKELDLQVVVPVDDMRELGQSVAYANPAEADGSALLTSTEGGTNSIWPSIYPEILRLVEEHRSTIVFVNNRRLAERLALRLNELANEKTDPDQPLREIARAHHGSLAREQRQLVEEDLKAGRIPCLVATSSLELGIDMGAVDLVIQVESPKSVARGLQRIGRAGHELGAVSKGRIFPKFRADLLESAVVARAMREGAIEETTIPRNPLDVLAQQIVAIAADEEIARRRPARARHAAPIRSRISRARSSRTCSTCSPAATPPTSSPSSARASSGIAPRGVIRARDGARRLAVTNAGTIPDRGLFGVFLVGGGGRVGELDEEMVYEARAGQTFLLGASTWRIEEITRDRVLVSPAPGVPGCRPVLEGRRGRPAVRARAEDRRDASRELSALARRAPLSTGSATTTTSTTARRRTCSRSCVSRRMRQARSRRIAPSSSSASATRSATGASAS